MQKCQLEEVLKKDEVIEKELDLPESKSAKMHKSLLKLHFTFPFMTVIVSVWGVNAKPAKPRF